ncbi:hypothetical protein [Nocardia farcinica]|uniref:hypothetical protein n=1 Tax=Nocardia farcinica TaxID=37329 RepID=UPI000E1B81C1|nr:hypothetical protein [Nocardia farcinica]
MPIRVGDVAPLRFYGGDLLASRIYAGDTLVYSSFVPVSMIKNGNHTLGSSFADIPNWSPDPAYPGSVIDSTTGLVVAQAKTGATVACNIRIENTSSISRSYQLRMMLNGQVIASQPSTSVPAREVRDFSLSAQANVSTGDIVKVQALASSSLGSNVLGGPVTWVRVS